MPIDKPTAYHEAGHAIVAMAFGWQVERRGRGVAQSKTGELISARILSISWLHFSLKIG